MSYPDITLDVVCDFCGKSDSSGEMEQTERGWRHKECWNTGARIGALLDETITAMENWKFIGFGDRAAIIKRLKEEKARMRV